MTWISHHNFTPRASFDGGDLDCGNGLLLLIRKHLGPLDPGQYLEILSTDATVEEDLPAWARLTGNILVSQVKEGDRRSYLVRKAGSLREELDKPQLQPLAPLVEREPALLSPLPRFAVTGIGSWPRPPWMLKAIHDSLENRLSEEAFQAIADDAVRLAVQAQEQAKVDLVTDGEQRRDSYAGFVGSRLENCQLIPLTDLLPYVDNPEKFSQELKALDVPAGEIHHPAVLGKLSRKKPLAGHELAFLRKVSSKPAKVALPGPYLLTRTLWLECVSEKVYRKREDLAETILAILREEISELLESGARIVQLDEPVLTEVVFGQAKKQRSFMCGALGERKDPEQELAFAGELLRAVLQGFPRDRLALHICRGNWSPDESVALAGDYRPLIPLLKKVPVGILYLEMCTPRAGEMEVLSSLSEEVQIGLGMVNPKSPQVEAVPEIVAKGDKAVSLFGADRVMLNPDCGFATFADNPVSGAEIAQGKLQALAQAGEELRRRHGQGGR
ncbi:MAG: 5-methyltetrahydropteroyltriglutamate--homocysteine methyltransferase [Gemmataceae bacterium]|nr:5-methyltetrahydropteroyltriglutamate--homocysteine methyltransferase [Gemmataceae bacterium]